MLGRKSIKGALAVLAAVVLVAAFASQASAFSAGGSTPFTYTGRIVDIDKAHDLVTVQAGLNDERLFALTDGAVVMCGMPGSSDLTIGSADDLKIGDLVTVSYFEESDTYIASEVDFGAYGAMRRC